MMELRKVLLVDDDDELRKLGEIVLRKLGRWEARVAASGEEALAIARAERPDLILLDVMMPGMDGLTTLARLREDAATADIPVIFLTAAGEFEASTGPGVLGVIHKPFEPLGLPAAIRSLLIG